MKALIDSAFDHSRTVISTLILILVAGAVAFIEIPKESEPDINIPIIYVKLDHDGISPEDAERLLIRPMEQELRVIEGLKEMRATGFEGGASVILEFEAGFDAAQAMRDVREKVDLAKPDLPDATEEPTVHEVNFSLFPVILVAISGDLPERTLHRLARDLRDAVQGISTVLKAEIAGDREESVEILIDPVRVESYGMTLADANAIVGGSNRLVAAGAQDTGLGRFAVKVPGLYESVQDIMAQPVKADGDAAVRLMDIGEARRTFKDPEGFARIKGRPALVLEVSKRTGQNIIETIEAVRRVVEEERNAWPDDLRRAVHIDFLQDKSEDIRVMLADLQNNVIAAVLLVMVVVVGALGWRSAGLVGLAIPGSFLAAILLLFMLGMTINMVVLFSLILAVGMLVDGAIVVTEYADRKMAEGEPRRMAYALAAKRMAHPVMASTATTLAAFLPLLFWPGLVGEFMKFLPITLIATLTASLFMALVFIPTVGAQVGRPGAANPEVMRALAVGEPLDHLFQLKGPGGYYIRLLNLAISHPGKVLVLALALLIGVQAAYAQFGKGVEFFPEVEPELAKLQIRARGNLSAWEKDGLVREVEASILGIEGLQSVYARSGHEEMSQEAEDIIGAITLEFTDWQHRPPASLILEEVRLKTEGLAGIHVDRRKEEAGPPVGKPVQIELSSRLPELLEPAVSKVRARLESMEGLINIEDSRPMPGIDWQIKVDRIQAAKFGADVGTVGQSVQLVTNGFNVGSFRPDDSIDEIDILIRYPPEYRGIERLDQIRLSTPEGAVPISTFVKREAKPKVGTINRTDARRVMTVKADVDEGVLVDAKLREIEAWLAEDRPLDHQVKVRFRGEDEEREKASSFLTKAFAVALAIMAIILVTQFNSFYSAFLILSAVIMSTIGVFIGLMATGQPFGIVMSGIGVIALAGIVVNNNIVLIDTFDRLSEIPGTTAREAILRTGAQRLRPVLLTTITTMLGLMPMVLGFNVDFVTREVTVGAPSTQWWTQLSTAIVFGLGFATVLTLVVTPAALMFKANLHRWRIRVMDRIWLSRARRQMRR